MSINIETGAVIAVDVLFSRSAIPHIVELARELDFASEFSGNIGGLDDDDLRAYVNQALRIIFVNPDGPARLADVPAVIGWDVEVEPR